jgi:hydroxymethylglutaryl-CoA lyase
MEKVLLEDESLRDGLQFEDKIFPLKKKLQIFNQLKQAGVKRIQVGSFVNPKVVPQMADTQEFIREVAGEVGILITGLVLNDKGLDRALASGLTHISLSLSASDTHSQKNVRKTYDEALTSVTQLIRMATAAGIKVRAGVQCAFGCVYEGAVPEERVLDTLGLMRDAGATEFNLADTTGMANPLQVRKLIGQAQTILPKNSLSLHLHDTRGLAIANMVAGYEAGVRIFDTSAGGLGGCPFVKGAAGNIATEDAVNLFESMGVDTGIDLKKISEVGFLYETMLDRQLPARMGRVLKNLQECSV